ncbi:MAG: hypothetical protein GX280_02300 [Lentisphaerae bacterium]|nr:hypothetical protein [Lentisphaerota bacterium]
MSKFDKIIIGSVITFAGFFILGIGVIVYNSYKCARIPVYQTVITDFEIQPLKIKVSKDLHAEMLVEIQKIIEQFEIKTLQCFIFQGHSQRPSYLVNMVGKISDNKTLANISEQKLPLNDHTILQATLKLCGANPKEDDSFFELNVLWIHKILIYKNYIIISMSVSNPTYLNSDAEKQAFLEKFIRNKKR